MIQANGKIHLLHRFILGYTGNLVVDHINGDRADNSNENLRVVSSAINAQNKKSITSASGYFGVFKNKSKWLTRTRTNGEQMNCGTYEDPELAGWVYNQVATLIHGDICRKNNVKCFSGVYKVEQVETKYGKDSLDSCQIIISEYNIIPIVTKNKTKNKTIKNRLELFFQKRSSFICVIPRFVSDGFLSDVNHL